MTFISQLDKDLERDTASIIEDKLHCRVYLYNGDTNRFDGFLVKEGDIEVTYMLELKARNIHSKKYKDIILSARKCFEMKLHYALMKKDVLLVFRFSDCIKGILASKIDCRNMIFGGRNNMRSHNDKEALILIPECDMKLISTLE